MSKRLEILKKSLIKKEQLLADKFEQHFSDVKRANGQPLNDKRNGQSTLNRWERQDEAIRTLKKGIEKTKQAIEKEEDKIIGCKMVNENLPIELINLINEGKITQWRKFPNRFFVVGVERARLVWNENNKIVMHQYVNEIPRKTGQFEIFKDVFNFLNNTINKK